MSSFEPPESGQDRERLIEILTGVKASKRTYYSEYREKARSLDRAIGSIARISAALVNTTNGVPALAEAIVRVAAEHFEADWALLTLQNAGRWLAYRVGFEIRLLDPALAPVGFGPLVQTVIAEQQLIPPQPFTTPALYGVPMLLGDQVVGVLAAGLQFRPRLDDHEVLILQTLANQAAVAIENAQLYAASERLRTEATELYEAAHKQKTELEAKNRELEQATRRLAVARQHEIINNERSRIARELHDSVAQHLLSIGMTLEWCRSQVAPETPVAERIVVAKELARDAVTRIRATIFELSTISDQADGLVVALRKLVGEFEQLSRMAITLRVVGTPISLPPPASHALYQIVQEALFNAYKHAQAASVTLRVHFASDLIRLTVSDDGVGIRREQVRNAGQDRVSSHYGLRNMRERAAELGGRCRIGRGPRGGTVVRIDVPLE